MAKQHRSSKLAVILHADIAGSTQLVHQDEQLAHERIQESFRRFGDIITRYQGRVRELRGDALLAEFERASGAVSAALAFQEEQADYIRGLDDGIQPAARVGIAMGEVVIADNTITGAGVVLAQRLEQLAEPGNVVIQALVHETIPKRYPFAYRDLGTHQVKGFDQPVQAYGVELEGEASIPLPDKADYRLRNGVTALVVFAVIVGGAALWWLKPWEVREEPASIERMAFPLPEKPSIAILPFSALSESDEHTYIANGLTENIIATLGMISGLFVIDRGVVSRYNDGSIQAHRVSEELGVRYVLKGSIQKSDDRLRVTVTLVDTSTGRHIWSERYNRDMGDLFSVQDEITGQIVVELQVNLTEGEQARLRYDATTNFDAWANFIRASELFLHFTKEDNAKARELVERAVDLDPQYAVAWSWLAWTHWIDARFGYSESRETSFIRAEELATRAAELDPELANALSLFGAIHLYKREYYKALNNGRKSIELSPNNAVNHATLAITTYSVGDWGETIKLLQQAMRLSPYYPSWYLLYLGRAQTFQGNFKEAIETYEKGLARADSLKSGFHAALAFAHMEAGNEQRAQEYMTQTLELAPHYSASYVKKTNFFKDTNDRDRLIRALRKAGMPEHPLPKLPDKPTIAVLPFTNMSSDAEQEYFADGLTEDLITDISKISSLDVIARHSTFSYKGQVPDVRDVGRDLGASHVIEGSVRKTGSTIRITIQLINALDGTHVWAERYDRELKDVFVIQDEVIREIISVLSLKLTPEEEVRIVKHGTENLEAYDLYMRGRQQESFFSKESNMEAEQFYEQAIALDPNFAEAWAHLAQIHTLNGQFDWVDDIVAADKRALELVEKSIELDPNIPATRFAYSRILARNSIGQHIRAIAEAKKAIELDSNFADAYAYLGQLFVNTGQAEKAIEPITRAMSINPIFPFWYYYTYGFAHYFMRDYDVAVEYIEKAVDRNPNVIFVLAAYASALAMAGHQDDAEWQIEELYSLGFNKLLDDYLDENPIHDSAYRDRFREGLSRAGLR